jgi:hypothetical protein
MKHLSGITVVLLAFSLSACETMQPANYSNFADNSLALRMYPNTKVAVAALNDQSMFDPSCRLVGPVKASGNRTIPQFIQDSFNDELKFANLYSTDQSSAKLNATLISAKFSSSSGLTEGWWDFTIKLANPANNKELTTSYKYDFHSGFAAEVACSNSSQALTPAVQRLINKTVTDPTFPALIAR